VSGAALTVDGDDSNAELLASLACDAQTSGGLLLCVPSEQADACVAELRAANLPATAIGILTARGSGASIMLRWGF
jgi:selenophosphate synthase